MSIPDLLTHLLVGISVALLIRRNGPRSEQMLIVLGSVLIDIERPASWLLEGTSLEWIGLTGAFHSILGALVLSYVAAACFELPATPFNSRFRLILYGCISHLLLDMTMYSWTELGLPLLYPLKLYFSFHLVWPDFPFFPLFGGLVLIAAICIRYLILRNRV